MSESTYIFTDTQFESELVRLQALEKVYDPASCDRLLAAGTVSLQKILRLGLFI